MEKVQRRATKIPRLLHKYSYEERLRKLNLTTLIYRRKRADIIQVFKMLKGYESLDAELFFTLDKSCTRGHSLKLVKPRAITRIRQYSFSHRIINDWNSLREGTVNSESINGFKTSLENEWKHHPNKYSMVR